MTMSNDHSGFPVSETSPPRELEDIEKEIAKCQQDCEQSFLTIGQLLLEAKKEVKKKKMDWLEWIQANVDFSICKAQRLMRVAKWMDGNEAPVPHSNLAHLDFTKAYILSRLTNEDLKTFSWTSSLRICPS